MKTHQRGVALITAMLMVAIIATIATSLALGQQVWLRQAENLAALAQAERIRQGAIEFAAAILVRDAKNSQTSATDHLNEDWAKPIPPLPVDGGAVAVIITDAQGRFNLNNLASAATPPPGTPSGNDVDLFRQLLVLNNLNPALIDALLGWMQGADDLDYLSNDPPYRAAKQRLTSVDELRLIKGFTPEVVEKLRPHVIALPASTTLNVNTASPTLLAALSNNSLTDAENIAATRPFKSTSDFQVRFPPNHKFNGSNYNITSQYFIVTIETRIGRTQRRTESLIERTPGSNSTAKALWYRQPTYKIILDEDKDKSS